MTNFDVVVIGGGAAGLSGAIVLARARRSVQVLDAGAPRNAPAAGVHSFLSRDGMPPGELLAAGRRELAGYGGAVRTGEAVGARRDADHFVVALADGTSSTARRLLVTTGVRDELPDVPGLAERWGQDVVHCPYCHGWELRDRAIGVLGSGPLSLHQAFLFRQWSSDLVFFQHTAPSIAEADRERLDARGIRLVTERVAAIESIEGRLSGVRLASGKVVPRAALAVASRPIARSAVLDDLGLAAVPSPMGAEVATLYLADATGATTLPGVYLAGNVADPMGNVISAAAQGAMAAARLNFDMAEEDTDRAVERRRRAG